MKWKSIKGCSLLDIFGLTISVLWKWNNIIWFSHRTDYLHLFYRAGHTVQSCQCWVASQTLHVSLDYGFDGQIYLCVYSKMDFRSFAKQIRMQLNRNLFVSTVCFMLNIIIAMENGKFIRTHFGIAVQHVQLLL